MIPSPHCLSGATPSWPSQSVAPAGLTPDCLHLIPQPTSWSDSDRQLSPLHRPSPTASPTLEPLLPPPRLAMEALNLSPSAAPEPPPCPPATSHSLQIPSQKPPVSQRRISPIHLDPELSLPLAGPPTPLQTFLLASPRTSFAGPSKAPQKQPPTHFPSGDTPALPTLHLCRPRAPHIS